MMTRRQALKQTALAGAICAASISRVTVAQPPPPRPGGPPRPGALPPPGGAPGTPPGEHFTLPPLPYAVDALEPHIDARTMELHHDKHHAAYVTNLNKAIADYPEWHHRPIEELLHELNRMPEKIRTQVRNMAGGHHNHSHFWLMMKPGGGGEPHGEVAKAIDKTFGGFAGFKQQLSDAAAKVFGSGWAWLVLEGKLLKIQETHNQDSPLSAGQFPLLGIDVWEHAYYLKYQYKRTEYIDSWFKVVNWDYVSERYRQDLARS